LIPVQHDHNQARLSFSFRNRLAIIAVAFALGITQFASAQTFQVLHNFSGGSDGGTPPYTLAQDAAGHLFGTANMGGQNGAGIVFKFARVNSSGFFLRCIASHRRTDSLAGA
jgi:hypothetical protein